MQIINNRIGLTALAEALGVTNQSLLNHLRPDTGLAEGVIKTGDKQTGEHLLSIDSVQKYLKWLLSKGKKVKYNTIITIQKEINEQINNHKN